jgi:citrate lyase beta subunit
VRTLGTGARGLGFGSEQVIHPAQTSPVVRAFGVSDGELARARAVDEAFTAAEAAVVLSTQLAEDTFVNTRGALTLLVRLGPPGAGPAGPRGLAC